MLIEFVTTNFTSINEEVRLSLVASAGKEFYDTNVTEHHQEYGSKIISLLNSVAIYGPNASGKSNLVRALQTMQTIVLNSSRNVKNPLPVTPFKLNDTKRKLPSEFEVVFLSEGIRFQFGFSVTRDRVHEEWLYAFPKGRVQLWFHRELDNLTGETNYTFGNRFSGNKYIWKDATRNNALFLSTAMQLNSKQLAPVFNWFSKTLRVIGLNDIPPDSTLEIYKLGEKSKILNFLKAADFAISDLLVNEDKFSHDSLPSDLPDFIRHFVSEPGSDITRLQLSTFHQSDSGKHVEFDLSDESSGSRKMFNIAGEVLNALKNRNVFVVDDLHDNLHPLLVSFIIKLFHNRDSNSKGSQLVFTTHDVTNLNQDLFRRDQIWFCERSSQQSTLLASLTDFRPRKGVENLQKAYLSGRYGAIPFVRNLLNSF